MDRWFLQTIEISNIFVQRLRGPFLWLFQFFYFFQTSSFPSKNVKPDAFSHLFGSTENATTTETILLNSCVVRAVVWGIEKLVRRARNRQALTLANHCALPHQSTNYAHLHLFCTVIKPAINAHTSSWLIVRSRFYTADYLPDLQWFPLP